MRSALVFVCLLAFVGCSRDITVDASELSKYKIDASLKFAPAVKYQNSRIIGVVSSTAERRYSAIWLIVYLYGGDGVVIRKAWLQLPNLEPGDRLRVDQEIDYDPAIRRAELKEVKLVR